jgi:hypothetical protein
MLTFRLPFPVPSLAGPSYPLEPAQELVAATTPCCHICALLLNGKSPDSQLPATYSYGIGHYRSGSLYLKGGYVET